MIFPININRYVKDAGKLDSGEKGKLYLSLAFIALVVGALVMRFVFVNILGVNPVYGYIILAFLAIFIFTIIFRQFIFKEDEKIEEYENSLSDSLSRYFYVRKDVVDSSVINNFPVNIFEYGDGTSMFCIKIRYGSNERERYDITKSCYSRIFRLLTNNRLEFRTINIKDRFEETPEYKDFVKKVSNIEDVKLSKAMLEIVDNILDTTENTTNVFCTNLVVRTRNSYQKYELPYIIKELTSILSEPYTSFKTIEFIDKDQLVTLMREFYGLEAIDLSMIKAIEPTRELLESYSNLVSIFQVISQEGKIYSSSKEKIEGVLSTNTIRIGGKKR